MNANPNSINNPNKLESDKCETLNMLKPLYLRNITYRDLEKKEN